MREAIEMDVDQPLESADHLRSVTVFHPAGRQPPILFIRSWLYELDIYQRLAAELGADRPVYTVAPPTGLERDAFPESVDEWAEWVHRQLGEISGDWVLGGNSFGGVIALALADRLGLSARGVLLLDTSLPRRPFKPTNGWHRLTHHMNELARAEGDARGRYMVERLQRLKQRLSGAPRRKERQDETPQQNVVTSTGKEMPLLQRAIWVCYLKYKPRAFELPVAMVRTQQSVDRAGDYLLGWSPWLRGAVNGATVPGGHYTFTEEERVPELCQVLRAQVRWILDQRDAGTDRRGAGADRSNTACQSDSEFSNVL